jgi:L-threonylcarbamoyladenylate synthase
VYGLAASTHYPEAIDQIFHLKGRPANNPLIVHVPSLDQIRDCALSFPDGFEILAEAFWPGSMTVILPVDPHKVPDRARAGLPTAAFRIPSHPLALELLNLSGPLVMPSANISGRPSATRPEHIEHDFGSHFPILDGGVCQRGLESTIILFRGDKWEIIRTGSIAAEDFLETLGYVPHINSSTQAAPLCPGQMYRHYAPKAKLLLTKPSENEEAVILGFLERDYPAKCRVLPMGSVLQPETVAENLYGLLRQLDAENISYAYVDMQFPSHGLWTTIYERIQKASGSSK